MHIFMSCNFPVAIATLRIPAIMKEKQDNCACSLFLVSSLKIEGKIFQSLSFQRPVISQRVYSLPYASIKMLNPDADLDYFDLDTDDSEMDSDSVMKEIQYLYNEPKVGLIDAAANLPDRHVTLTMPQNKMTVLLVGNHTIGKQKFLALYFSECRETNRGGFVQRINYEKLNKIYITHGMQRRLLMGESVLDYCPHLATLKNVPGRNKIPVMHDKKINKIS